MHAVRAVIEAGPPQIGLQSLPVSRRQSEPVVGDVEGPLAVEVDVHPEQMPLAKGLEVDLRRVEVAVVAVGIEQPDLDGAFSHHDRRASTGRTVAAIRGSVGRSRSRVLGVLPTGQVVTAGSSWCERCRGVAIGDYGRPSAPSLQTSAALARLAPWMHAVPGHGDPPAEGRGIVCTSRLGLGLAPTPRAAPGREAGLRR